MGNWRKFRQLDRIERRIFCCALALLPAAAVCLRLLGVRLTRGLFALAFARGTAMAGADRAQAERAARLVQAAAYHGIHKANCLQRSLVLWLLLGRAGITAEVRIGVRKESDQLRAHAWVECDGVVLNDRAEIVDEFSPFAAASRRGSCGRFATEAVGDARNEDRRR